MRMVRTVRSVLALVAVGALLALTTAAIAEEKTPDGTLEFSGGSVAAGIGFSWGSGTLKYKGKEYPISIDGLTVGAVGAASVSLKGSVYNLKSIDQFDGNYTGVGAGATVGGGGSVLTMRNQNGVVIEAVSTTQGLTLAIGTGGAKIKVKQ
jgi:hypothetical protein